MSWYLLDTNVISEIVKVAPDPQVRAFLTEQEDLWLPVIALHELNFGLNLLAPGQRRDDLHAALLDYVSSYSDCILPIGRAEAERAALLRVQARRAGCVLELADALIAGTAVVHDLILATRNVRDFADLGISVANPWDSP